MEKEFLGGFSVTITPCSCMLHNMAKTGF